MNLQLNCVMFNWETSGRGDDQVYVFGKGNEDKSNSTKKIHLDY